MDGRIDDSSYPSSARRTPKQIHVLAREDFDYIEILMDPWE